MQLHITRLHLERAPEKDRDGRRQALSSCRWIPSSCQGGLAPSTLKSSFRLLRQGVEVLPCCSCFSSAILWHHLLSAYVT